MGTCQPPSSAPLHLSSPSTGLPFALCVSRTFRITDADYTLLGSDCSATGNDSTLVLMSLGTFAALAHRQRCG